MSETNDLTEELAGVLQKLSVSVVGDDDTISPLARSWHFLQVYSTWGVRLPGDETMLKMSLGVQNPGEFDFFMPMQAAYAKLNSACGVFLTDVFPRVVEIGNSVAQFASDAGADKGDLFGVVGELLSTGDTESVDAAVELLGDLQRQAERNASAADEVTKSLASFKAQLAAGNHDLTEIREQVEADDRTSQATIEKLGGGENVAGSIANMLKNIHESEKKYKEAVIVASTTVTYAWNPIGFVAAVTVASIYGSKAAGLVKEIDRQEEELKNAQSDLQTAIAAHKVQNSADAALQQANLYTGLAIEHTTAVQNAWNGIAANLRVVSEKVVGMTRTSDEGVVVRNRSIVDVYVKMARAAWGALVEPLRALTANPYIHVEPRDLSLKEFAAQVEAATAEAEAA